MQLKTIMKLIKNNFMVDEKLKVYIYVDRIEFIDYTSPVKLPNGETLREFNGELVTMYYKNGIITAIEHHCLSLMTANNVSLYKGLCDLIGVEIEDLYKYPVITTDEWQENLVQIL